MEDEYIDFKKEFELFKKELENSKPIFDDESIEFNDFDNLISNSNSLISNSNSLISDSDMDTDFNEQYIDSNRNYPNISLETDDILLNLVIKKDYSKIKDSNKRKEMFFNDLKEFIKEFESTEESDELMKYYD